MGRKICISTGCFFNRHEDMDINKQIALCSKLDIDGVEILFGDAKRLLRQRISRDSINILRGFEFNTFHMPFHLKKKRMLFVNNRITRKVFAKVYDICDKADVVNINLHSPQIRNFRLFDRNYNYSIENMERKDKLKADDYKRFFRKHRNFRFVLDTTHASEAGELGELIRELKEHIVYFHLSANYFNHLHLPLHVLKEKYLSGLNLLKGLKVPVVIENQIGTDGIKEYKEEIGFVRKWLS